MLNRLISVPIFTLLLTVFSVNRAGAQCTNATINWTNVDYLVSTGSYSPYVTTAMAATQRFAIGINAMTIAYSGTITNNGLSAANTGDAGSDLFFDAVANNGNTATITLTFDSEVSTVKFSIFDIDRRQVVTVNGKNAANANVSTTIAKRSGSILTLSPVSGVGTAPSATSSNTTVADNSDDGTLDVTIAGPVKTITLSISNTGSVNSEELYLSNITACVTGSFPANYYLISKPFAGQPGYVLTVVDNDFYYVNPANGVARFLFTDPGAAYINSVGYDPYNRFIYYTYSLTSNPANDKALKRYDVNTRTISTVLSNITTLGIPVYDYGIESGSAAFYNGSLFLGIEGYNDDFDKGRKSIVWRIDFNGSNVPYRASQVYASLADNGSGSIKHDWSDIGCSAGKLYDFDGAAGDEDFYVYDMQTGGVTNYNPSGSIVGRQVAIGWDEKIYNVDGTINQYNLTNGHVAGTTYTITSTPAIPGGLSWGDAGEAYKPFVDYGDAPATYDGASVDPAVHDSSGTTLRIGAAFNTEGAKRGLTSSEDNYDDGLASVPFLPSGWGAYVAQVSVFNNTGANATLCAWLDYNANGVFDTGEGISQVVTTSPVAQLKYLYWPSITNTLTNGSYTYLRIRITSTANGMTTSTPAGYFANGEVEDYRVRVDNFPLAVSMLSFDAKAIDNNKVKLNWSASEDANFTIYDIERSADGNNWSHYSFTDARHAAGINNYELTDNHPLKGTSYYRLKLGSDNGVAKYSAVRVVSIKDLTSLVAIAPNPASDHTTVNIYSNDAQATAFIRIINMQGNEIFSQKTILKQGDNPINIPVQSSWSTGLYMVQIGKGDEITNKKLLIKR